MDVAVTAMVADKTNSGRCKIGGVAELGWQNDIDVLVLLQKLLHWSACVGAERH